MRKSKITEIYPLSSMQLTLLVHSLQAGEDQGFLQVRCTLQGDLKVEVFKDAFHAVFKRHKALRVSVYWENISKPVQVVHEDFKIPWNDLDWRIYSQEAQSTNLGDFLAEDRVAKIDLTKPPVSRISLIRMSEDLHELIWTCHHILVDGWSSFQALTDILTVYDGLIQGLLPDLPPVPSYFDHLKWVQTQDKTDAKYFWRTYLKGIAQGSNVAIENMHSAVESESSTLHFTIDKRQGDFLKSFARNNSVTLNSVFQAFWAVILCEFLHSEDILYGITTNGRSGTGLSDSESVVGLFMSVLPLRARLGQSKDLAELARQIQSSLHSAAQYEYLGLKEILEYSQDRELGSLFDTLFIYQNFPEFILEGGGLRITAFDSSVTSTYPLTCVVSPSAEIIVSIKTIGQYS